MTDDKRQKLHERIEWERADIEFERNLIDSMNKEKSKIKKKPELIPLLDEIIESCNQHILESKSNIKKIMKGV